MFAIRTDVPIPTGRGTYDLAAFTAAGQAAFLPAAERGKKAASLRASARRYTEETGVAFMVRAGEDNGVEGVWIWRTTPAGGEAPVAAKPTPAAPAAPTKPAKAKK